MIIYILKTEFEGEEQEWCNGLGVNSSMLWSLRGALQFTDFNESCDIKLEICPV